jgi:hypothetical protein
MSYSLHITRKENWSGEGSVISESEWKEVLKKHPEFVPAPVQPSNVFYWENPDTKVQYPFYFWRGNVDIDHADDIVTKKAKEIAHDLSAKVQGDDGEVY